MHSIKEGVARVLHEVPAIGNLCRLWQASGRRFAITASPVARDHLNTGMLGEPGGRGCDLPVGQQCDDTPALKIANDRAVAVVAAERPVVNPDHGQRRQSRAGAFAYDPKERVVADRQHQTLGESRAGTSAEREAEVMDYALEARRAPRPHVQYAAEALGKDPAPAMPCRADKAPGGDLEAKPPTGTGQIRDVAFIAAMDTS
jgi:hypothetical protein